MEGYAFDTIVQPYPTKFFVSRTEDHNQIYQFVAHRSNNKVDHSGGFFITKFVDPNLIFAVEDTTNSGCEDNCGRCSRRSKTNCMVCLNETYYLYDHKCYKDVCPRYTFDIKDEGLNKLHFCKKCHFSCK